MWARRPLAARVSIGRVQGGRRERISIVSQGSPQIPTLNAVLSGRSLAVTPEYSRLVLTARIIPR